MTVKQVSDLSFRELGKRFLTSLKASNRYSRSYLDSLEQTVALTALYAEEQWWPPVNGVTVDHIEAYLAYLQERPRWFGEREAASPQNLSQGYINAQYRRLYRFFNWLVEREHISDNPLRLIEPPRVDEKTVPVVTEEQMRDLCLSRTRHWPEPVSNDSSGSATGLCCTYSRTRPGASKRYPSWTLITWTWRMVLLRSWGRAERSGGCP